MNTIAEKVFSNVLKHPQKIAIVDHEGTRETTWTQLLETATMIACHARREGLSGIVPILQGRTMEYVASILGLNMAGIAVINLTDTYPKERVNYICEDVGATVCVDDAFVESAVGFPAEPFEPCGDLSDIAMLFYTSGSTGVPKGVVYDNNCLVQSIAHNIKEASLDKSVVYASTAMFSFAMAQFELLATLAAGATVHILTEHCRKDIAEMTEYFNRYQVTHAFIPYQLFKQIYTPLPFMKLVLLAGEKITDIAPQTYRIIICYAMSETTAFVTYFTLDKAYDIPPIGKPTEDMVVYLMDENGSLCDEGEICIVGPIAKGYWNRPELTEKTFVPNPFATGEHDQILLHTGDIAKRLPDGNLLFLNRNDCMVKISGQRVEPGEIEAVMQRIPGIKQAVVKGFVNANGLTYLCGYYTVNTPISEEGIRAYLAKNLPAYMQPRYLTQLDALPTNINGKLDRLSLEAPKAAEFQAEYVAPETPEEALICRAFETVLNVKPIGVHDDFFRMGGDSLGVMELMIAAENLHLKTEAVFEGKTPRGIARLLQKGNTIHPDIFRDCQEERDFYPLTSSQRTVLRTYLLAPWSTAFNVPFIYEFPLKFDAERICEALHTVFLHYPILSARIIAQGGIYGMARRTDLDLEIPIIDIMEENIPQKKKEFLIPFNLEKDLLIRMILYRTERCIYLFWDVSHIIMDGASLSLFFNQFVRAYSGEALVPEQVTQLHFSNYEQKYLRSELFHEAQTFFERKLAGQISPSDPKFDHPEHAGGVKESNVVFHSFSGDKQIEKLEQFANMNGITISTFFAGAFSYALREMTKNEQIYFLSIESGRHDARLHLTMGQLIQYLPIVVSFKQETSIIERLQKLQTDFVESWFYDRYPFELLESKHGISNSIVFNYLGDILKGVQLSDHLLPNEFLNPETTHSNLIVCVFSSGTEYKLLIRYNSQAYEKSTIATLMDTYVQMIHHFLLSLG